MPIRILAAATPTGLGNAYDYKGTILGLGAFVALILLSYFVLRWISNRTIGSTSHMRVIERLVVSRDTALLLVQVGQKIMAVSATKDGLRFLCELSPDDITDLPDDKPSEPVDTDNNSTFLKRFSHNMRILMRLLPKDTPPARPPEKNPEPAAPVPSSFALALLKAQSEDDKSELIKLLNNDEPPSEPDPPPEPISEPDPISPPVISAGISGSSGMQDYNAAIANLKQMGKIENPVVPIAPTAAAALYKSALAPTHVPKQEPLFDPEPLPPRKEIPEPRVEIPKPRAEIPSPSRDDKVDELFDRISKRNSRYNKKT